MTDVEKGTLRALLAIYYDDLESDIEEAEQSGKATGELDDLLVSVDDVRSSLR